MRSMEIEASMFGRIRAVVSPHPAVTAARSGPTSPQGGEVKVKAELATRVGMREVVPPHPAGRFAAGHLPRQAGKGSRRRPGGSQGGGWTLTMYNARPCKTVRPSL